MDSNWITDLEYLVETVRSGHLSSKLSKVVVKIMLETGQHPADIIKEQGLIQLGDHYAVIPELTTLLDAYQGVPSDELLIEYLMKETKGKVNPALIKFTVGIWEGKHK
jgi:Asp-tRNA(Asn)/Glu-tRNA(Gln) amidotransferase B subunit